MLSHSFLLSIFSHYIPLFEAKESEILLPEDKDECRWVYRDDKISRMGTRLERLLPWREFHL